MIIIEIYDMMLKNTMLYWCIVFLLINILIELSVVMLRSDDKDMYIFNDIQRCRCEAENKLLDLNIHHDKHPYIYCYYCHEKIYIK